MNSFKTGKLIALVRKEKGLTQTDFANMLQISNRTVSKWENGDGFPDITLLPQICSILEITSDELLAGERNTHNVAEAPQVLFEAVMTPRVRDYKVLFDHYLSSISPKWHVLLLLICLIIADILAYYIGAVGLPVFIVSGVVILFSVFLLLYPRCMALLQIKNLKDFNNGELCDEHIVVSDKIYLECGANRNYFDLSAVTGIYEKKELYLIRFGKRVYAYLRKDSFTVGEADDFAPFIRSRMTIKKESPLLKILSFVLIIIVLSLTITATIIVSVANVNNTKYSYDNYIVMSVSELEELNDDRLYEAISSRICEKYYNDEELNEYSKSFFYIDDFIVSYEDGGLCQYLYNCNEGDIIELYDALDNIGMSELSQKLESFISDNDIDIYSFNSKEDYDKLYDKYNFAELDKSIENDCKLLKINLLEYVKNNINMY